MEASETTPNENQEQSNEGRIALWQGKNRDKGENHPYFTGRLTIESKEYFVVLWKRKRQSNRQPILSGQVSPNQDQEVMPDE